MKKLLTILILFLSATFVYAAPPDNHDGTGLQSYTLNSSTMITETGSGIASLRYRQGPMDGTPEYQMDATAQTAGATTLTIGQGTNALTDIVFVQLASATAPPTGVTFNGNAMIGIYTANAANVVYYSTTIPATDGTYNIVATYAASQAIVGQSVAIKGVSAPFIGAVQTEEAVTGVAIGINPASVEGDLMIDFLSMPIAGATHGVSQAIRRQADNTTRFLTISTKTAGVGGTTNMMWSWTGSQAARLGSVAIKKGNYNYGLHTNWANPANNVNVILPETEIPVAIELEATDLAGNVGTGDLVLPYAALSDPCSSALICQNFEGTGYDNSETWSEYNGGGGSEGTIDEDYTGVVLRGSQSLRILGSDSDWSETHTDFTASGTVYGFARLRIIDFPGFGLGFITLRNASGSEVMTLQLETDGTITSKANNTDSTGSLAMSLNTTYYVWWYYAKGTGANANWWVRISSNGTMPGSNDSGGTAGNSTADAARLQYSWVGAGNEIILDQTIIKTTSIGDVE